MNCFEHKPSKNSVDLNLIGQEGRKECERYSTEECSGNPRFEHQVLVAGRDLSRGKTLALIDEYASFFFLPFIDETRSGIQVFCLAENWDRVVFTGTGEIPSLLQH